SAVSSSRASRFVEIFEVSSQGTSCIAEIPSPNDVHDRRKELEPSCWDHLELVIDASRCALWRKQEPVAAAKVSDVRNNANAFVFLELSEFLHDRAEPAQFPLKLRADACLAVAQAASATDRRVPFMKSGRIRDCREHVVNGPLYHLRESDHRHGAPLRYA